MVMGRKDIGLHKLKGKSLSLFTRVDAVKDGGEAHLKAFEPKSSKVLICV